MSRCLSYEHLSLEFSPGQTTFVAMAPPPTPASLPRRILVVDDECLVRDSLRMVLEFTGHSVEVTANGEEALALLQKSFFDLIITDYEMPGMKGDQLAAVIKARYPNWPCLDLVDRGCVNV